MPSPELTVLLPCLNESETLASCIGKAQGSIEALGIDGEVLVADNGSTDGSQQIARTLGARVIDVPERGYGSALRAGIAAARGTYVVMADADDSYALDDLGPFVERLRGGADLVMGNRFAGGIEPGAMPWLHRYVGNPVLSAMGRTLFHIDIGDFHCGMRGFRRDSVSRLGLQTPGMEFASEMVVRSAMAGLTIVEAPTTLRPDGRSRDPHLRTWRDGWRHLKFMLAFSPRWLFLYPSIVLTVVGVLGMLWLATGPKDLGPVELDIQTMLAFATMTVVGLEALGFALVSRAYGEHLGLLPPSRRFTTFLERFTLERGVVLGAVLTLLGLGCFVYATVRWSSTGFGPLDVSATMRLPIIGMTLLVAGFQLGLVSFALSLTRIGDH